MKKNYHFFVGEKIHPKLKKILLIMKLTVFLILLSIMQVFAVDAYAQNTRLTFELVDVTVKDVLGEIENMSEFYFLYSTKIIDVSRELDISAKNERITKILKKLFPGDDVDFVVKGRQIVLTSNELANSFRGFGEQQQKIITGTVTDNIGRPLPGVSVVVKGTTIGVATDVNGNFSLNISGDAVVLIFSFIGMESQEVAIGKQSYVNVAMQANAIGLEEVVAIGYGTVRKGDLTGAVSTVNTSDLENLPSSSAMRALQGRVAGLSVVSTSGQPGASSQVTVRGVQSISGTNSPIYVVDGVIMSSIDHLNQNDFESVSVLKDASAAAIYGARAANGVILVNTKRGKKSSTPTLSYNGYYGVQNLSNLQPELLDGLNWMNLYREAFETSGLLESQFPEEAFIEENYGYKWDAGKDSYVPLSNAVNSDWMDAMLRTGKVQKHDISLSGGGENSNYYFSAGYYDNEGMVKGTSYKKLNVTFNSDYKIGKLFDFGHSLLVTNSNIEGQRQQYALVLAKPPITRVYEEDGSWGVVNNTTMEHMHPNPVWLSENSVPDYSKGTSIRGNLYLTAHLLDGLDFTAKTNASKSFNNLVQFHAGTNPDWGWEGSTINSIHKRRNESLWWNTELVLNYVKTFNDVHDVKVMIGYSNEESVSEFIDAGRQGTPNNKIPYLGAGKPDSQTNDDGCTDWSFISYFGRLNYTFNSKYLLTATIRRDGTSRLAEGQKWGVFPSISGAWRISSESFMQDINWLDDLKIRASYGSLGNVLSISPYGTIADLTQVKLVNGQSPFAGYTLMKAVNTDLQWEVTDKLDIGLDGTFFDNSVYFSFDYYKEVTHDLLFSLAIPYTTGYGGSFPNVNGKPTINAGEVQNKGFEGLVGWRKTVNDWNFDISFNFSHVNNEVIDLAGQNLKTQGLMEGYPVRSFFGYTDDGLILNEDQKTGQWSGKDIGDIHIVDMPTLDEDGNVVEPDGTITPADRGIIGNRYPSLTYGFLSKIGYKGFTLQLQLSGVSGIDKYMFGGAHHAYNYFYSWAKNDVVDLLNRYHETRNPDGTLPRLDKKNSGKNDQTSTFWLRDASYLRIQNISLNYDFKSMLTNIDAIKNLGVYVSVENLYTFTKFPLAEVDTRRDPMTGIPMPRTVVFGVKASF